jgi:hypothetical protein
LPFIILPKKNGKMMNAAAQPRRPTDNSVPTGGTALGSFGRTWLT